MYNENNCGLLSGEDENVKRLQTEGQTTHN